MLKATKKTHCFALENERIGGLHMAQHDDERGQQPPRCHSAPALHCAPPSSKATRCTVQNAPSEPTVNPGNIAAQRGQRISRMRKARSSSSTSTTNPICPISTPT